MTVPLILALALIQAPAAPAMDLQLPTASVEPRLAAGIKVVTVQRPVPSPATVTGPVVVGVIPGVGAADWTSWYVANASTRRLSLRESDWFRWQEWKAQQAQSREFYETNVGYRAGHQMAIDKARGEGRPPPVNYGLRSSGPGPLSSSAVARGPAVSQPSGAVGGGSGGGRASGGKGGPGRLDLP